MPNRLLSPFICVAGLKSTLFHILILFGGCAVAWAAADQKPLNVIVLVAEDMDSDLACLGFDPAPKTPHIDALGKRAVGFSNAYPQVPLCNPSRTSFLSGKRPETTRVLDNRIPPNFHVPDLEFFPQHFQQSGYATYGVGKVAQQNWKDFNAKGWDEFQTLGIRWRGKDHPPLRAIGTPRGRFYEYDGEEADLNDSERVRVAMGFLNKASQDTKPFLLYVGFRETHAQSLIPKRFWEMYNKDDLPWKLPVTRKPDYYGKYGEDELKEEILAYYAAVSHLDSLMGEILDEVTRLNLWENTVVVFLSDHSFHGKDRLRAVRVPLIIYSPGAAGNGRVCRRVVELLDVYPTLVELCGVPKPEGLEGRSLVPLLNDPSMKWDHCAQTDYVRVENQEQKDVGRAISSENFRYIEWEDLGDGSITQELYNLEIDPEETNNVADDAQYAEIIQQLRSQIIRGETQLGRSENDLNTRRNNAAKDKAKDNGGDGDD